MYCIYECNNSLNNFIEIFKKIFNIYMINYKKKYLKYKKKYLNLKKKLKGESMKQHHWIMLLIL